MTKYTFDKTKGQSAIEYLMTYGWMLLVVAIVGGAIFATVQGQCTQSTSGFSGGDVLVEDFGIDNEGNLQMEVRNGGSNTLELNEVTFDSDSDDAVTFERENDDNLDGGESIGVGNSETVTLEDGNFDSSDGCNDWEIEFEYDFSGGLGDQVTTGTLTDSIEYDDA